MIAEMEGDPTISREHREGTIEVAKHHSNWELRNLGRRIYFESNAEERARMPPQVRRRSISSAGEGRR